MYSSLPCWVDWNFPWACTAYMKLQRESDVSKLQGYYYDITVFLSFIISYRCTYYNIIIMNNIIKNELCMTSSLNELYSVCNILYEYNVQCHVTGRASMWAGNWMKLYCHLCPSQYLKVCPEDTVTWWISKSVYAWITALAIVITFIIQRLSMFQI